MSQLERRLGFATKKSTNIHKHKRRLQLQAPWFYEEIKASTGKQFAVPSEEMTE